MTDGDSLAQQVYLIADELRGIANLSKHYASSVYEAERSDQVMRLAARLASLVDRAPAGVLTEMFEDEAWRRVSPAIGVEAVVVNDDQAILLCQRQDNQHWCLPGGIAEIGQPTTDAALRELWEEAGLRGEVTRLLGIFDGPRWGTRSTAHIIHLVYEVTCDHHDPAPGTEMIATRFFSPPELPQPMHAGHDLRVPVCLDLLRTGRTHHDPASSVGIDLPMHQRPVRP